MIYLIRHGESMHNIDSSRVAGRALKSSLTDRGRQQAIQVGDSLKDKNISVIYHSTASRAIETAELIAGQFEQKPELFADERLLEMAQGDIVGKYKLVVLFNPSTMLRIIFRRFDFSFNNGESFRQVAQRMEQAINQFSNQYNDDILVVTHGLSIRCLLAERYNWSVWKLLINRIKYAQIVKINYD